jgi:hypothetical protein
MENPVYYVQYAHARISSLIRMADERGFDHGAVDDADLTLLEHPAEHELLRAMARLPLEIAEAAELRATQRLARYAEELAGTFHRFYTECRVLAPDDDDRSADEQAALDAARSCPLLAGGRGAPGAGRRAGAAARLRPRTDVTTMPGPWPLTATATTTGCCTSAVWP